jgi:hypothetical protein
MMDPDSSQHPGSRPAIRRRDKGKHPRARSSAVTPADTSRPTGEGGVDDQILPETYEVEVAEQGQERSNSTRCRDVEREGLVGPAFPDACG